MARKYKKSLRIEIETNSHIFNCYTYLMVESSIMRYLYKLNCPFNPKKTQRNKICRLSDYHTKDTSLKKLTNNNPSRVKQNGITFSQEVDVNL